MHTLTSTAQPKSNGKTALIIIAFANVLLCSIDGDEEREIDNVVEPCVAPP